MANKVYLIVRNPVTLTALPGSKMGVDSYSFEGTEEDSITVSDGYHTMDELYEHRYRLYLALVKIYDNYITPLGCEVKCWKSMLHSDGSSYEGWFLLGMTVTKPPTNFVGESETFQISYHLPIKYWDLAKVMRYEKAPKWDGHTSNDVLERLLRL